MLRKGTEVPNIFGIVPTLVVVAVELFGNRIRTGHTGEVGNETEPCDTDVGLRAVEFRNNIRCSWSLAHYYHRTEIPGLHFTVEGVLNPSVAHQYKSSRLEVEINDSGQVLLLKLFQVANSGLCDYRAHLFQLFRSLLELTCAKCNQILGRHPGVLGRGQIGRLDDVKRENGMNAVSHEVRRVSCGNQWMRKKPGKGVTC